jgi:hypothetical protein
MYSAWSNSLPFHNLSIQDTIGSLAAVVVFLVVLYAPGYLASWTVDLFGFRRMGFGDRSLWSMAVSLAVVPVFSYWVARFAGMQCLLWTLLAATAAAAVLVLWERPTWTVRERWVTALMIAGCALSMLLMLVDVHIGGKLYFGVVVADQSYRVAFTDALLRGGVPPANPLYFPGAPAGMRYYYFWYLITAVVAHVLHVTVRQAFIASSICAGLALLVTLRLYTVEFFHWERKQRWIVLGLLAVTGADLLPAVGNAVLQPSLNGDMEWWSVDPIDSWPDSLMWVPHHTASALCCLLGFLFLWKVMESKSRRGRLGAICLAGAAFASAFGMSVYVAIGFALLLGGWLIYMLFWVHRHRWTMWQNTVLAGLLSTALLAPFLHELVKSFHETAAGKAGGSSDYGSPLAHLFTLQVRKMIDSDLVTGLPCFAGLMRAHPVLTDELMRLLLLIPGLALELGVYGAVLAMLLGAYRRRWPMPKDDARVAATFFCLSGLAVSMFLSSSVITNNDFGYRVVMLPMFFLLLLTAEVLGSWWLPGRECIVPLNKTRKRLIWALLVLGFAGTVYGALLLRAWLPLEVRRTGDGFSDLPADAYQMRQAFTVLDGVSRTDAVVGLRPFPPEEHVNLEVVMPHEIFQRLEVMDAGRQVLNAEWICAVQFGGNPAMCPEMQTETEELYADDAPEADEARRYCKHFGAQYLTVSHIDPIWSSHRGWPVELPVVAAEPGFRIVDCR